MAAPTVTRPARQDPSESESQSFLSKEKAAQWAKWAVLGTVGAGVIALIVVGIVSWTENARIERLRQNWDTLFTALKDKTTPETRFPALEGVMDKIKGSEAHAYALMELGDLYFEQAVKPSNYPEERAAALKKATSLYLLIAAQEPYRGNPALGPLALQNAALAQEQAQDYDAAIKLIQDEMVRTDLSGHFLYNKLVAQLGRLYYLRSLKKAEAGQDAQPDRELARKTLNDALVAAGAGRADQIRRDDGEFVSQLEYLKSLVDKPGKALPDGKAPPEKPAPAPEKAAAPADKPADKAKDEPKKDQPKKDEPKQEEPKK
jgi:hypothetical protein